MTVQELAKLLHTHISQGRALYQVAVFQWQHGSEPVVDLEVREGAQLVEIYTGPAPEQEDDTSDLV